MQNYYFFFVNNKKKGKRNVKFNLFSLDLSFNFKIYIFDDYIKILKKEKF